jgi:hypothetical protein
MLLPPVAGLHDAGPAAGDDVHRRLEPARLFGDDRGEAARLFVVARHRQVLLRDRQRGGVAGRVRIVDEALRHIGRHDARAAENHDRRFDALLVLHQLGLEQLELHAHRAHLFAQQEGGVGEGEAIRTLGAFVARCRGDATGGGVLPRSREVAAGEGWLVHARELKRSCPCRAAPRTPRSRRCAPCGFRSTPSSAHRASATARRARCRCRRAVSALPPPAGCR